MSKRRHVYAMMFALLVSMLTNAFGWAFNGEVFAHELDHEHHVLSLDPAAHLEAHQNAVATDEGHLDAATHLCLHAAGQYQPFFFTAPPLVPRQTVRKYRACLSPIPFLNPFQILRFILQETPSQASASSCAGCNP